VKKEVTQEELDNFLDKVLKYKPKKKKKKYPETDKIKNEENEQDE